MNHFDCRLFILIRPKEGGNYSRSSSFFIPLGWSRHARQRKKERRQYLIIFCFWQTEPLRPWQLHLQVFTLRYLGKLTISVGNMHKKGRAIVTLPSLCHRFTLTSRAVGPGLWVSILVAIQRLPFPSCSLGMCLALPLYPVPFAGWI
jgi:hypothetical protein